MAKSRIVRPINSQPDHNSLPNRLLCGSIDSPLPRRTCSCARVNANVACFHDNAFCYPAWRECRTSSLGYPVVNLMLKEPISNCIELTLSAMLDRQLKQMSFLTTEVYLACPIRATSPDNTECPARSDPKSAQRFSVKADRPTKTRVLLRRFVSR